MQTKEKVWSASIFCLYGVDRNTIEARIKLKVAARAFKTSDCSRKNILGLFAIARNQQNR
jgi:hypothetical protein